MKRIAVIIVNYRTPALSIACLNALGGSRGAFEDLLAIVVDGGSGDGSAETIARSIEANSQQAWAKSMPLPINGGFGFANNRAMLALSRDGTFPNAIALINPDARVRPGALEALTRLLEREPQAGAVGALLEHEDGRPQASAFHFPSLRGEFCRGARTALVERVLRQPASRIDLDVASEVPWVTGAAVLFRTEALRSVGLFDEGFFLYFEETDLMRRMRQRGWTVWHEPAARVVHEGGAATQLRDPETGRPLAKRLPQYWYEARRRYFVRAGGRAYAIAAGIAWLTGHLVWKLKRTLTGKDDDGPVRGSSDLIKYGLLPSASDMRDGSVAFGVDLFATPAWMRWQS